MRGVREARRSGTTPTTRMHIGCHHAGNVFGAVNQEGDDGRKRRVWRRRGGLPSRGEKGPSRPWTRRRPVSALMRQGWRRGFRI
eukprot:366276-Chlamydomonas_euryale.AAC.6